ncbi:hypothetical protein P8C59_004939 [Phyllachora maydis]|uniref:Glutathione S-transferase n=1 Tax=Phyllachora maydis TaxID=1825666 RepID=A0AAD9I4J3_9PEZI|nr:hypothetical protein P8C59_004939 [Phyllachora maydis]
MTKDDTYHLLYWPGFPGRGELIRLVLEAGGADYTDSALLPDGVNEVMALVQGKAPDDGRNPPVLAPPALRHGDLLISQTPNILLYLGARLGLVPRTAEDDGAVYRVNALALTALDGLCNEVHDCHHPMAVGLYYEDQKVEAARRSEDFVKNRLPKFLGYFERVLGSKSAGEGGWLYGGQMSHADLVLFQCLDGTKYAFPKAMTKLEKEGAYSKVFALHQAVKEVPKIKAYLASDRRQKYGKGLYRYYEELDFEA